MMLLVEEQENNNWPKGCRYTSIKFQRTKQKNINRVDRLFFFFLGKIWPTSLHTIEESKNFDFKTQCPIHLMSDLWKKSHLWWCHQSPLPWSVKPTIKNTHHPSIHFYLKKSMNKCDHKLTRLNLLIKAI